MMVLGYLARDRGEPLTLESRMAFLLRTVMLVMCSRMEASGFSSARMVTYYRVGCTFEERQHPLDSQRSYVSVTSPFPDLLD